MSALTPAFADYFHYSIRSQASIRKQFFYRYSRTARNPTKCSKWVSLGFFIVLGSQIYRTNKIIVFCKCEVECWKGLQLQLNSLCEHRTIYCQSWSERKKLNILKVLKGSLQCQCTISVWSRGLTKNGLLPYKHSEKIKNKKRSRFDRTFLKYLREMFSICANSTWKFISSTFWSADSLLAWRKHWEDLLTIGNDGPNVHMRFSRVAIAEQKQLMCMCTCIGNFASLFPGHNHTFRSHSSSRHVTVCFVPPRSRLFPALPTRFSKTSSMQRNPLRLNLP